MKITNLSLSKYKYTIDNTMNQLEEGQTLIVEFLRLSIKII